MDRREALSKLAVGGVTIVAASTVLTTPAFAAAAPSAPPTPSVTGGPNVGTSNTNGNISITFASFHTCGASATQKRILWDYAITSLTQMSSPTVNTPGGSANQTATNTPAVSPTLTFGWTRNAGVTNQMILIVRSTMSCVYPSSTTTLNRSWTYQWDRPSGGSWALTGPTVGTSAPA